MTEGVCRLRPGGLALHRSRARAAFNCFSSSPPSCAHGGAAPQALGGSGSRGPAGAPGSPAHPTAVPRRRAGSAGQQVHGHPSPERGRPRCVGPQKGSRSGPSYTRRKHPHHPTLPGQHTRQRLLANSVSFSFTTKWRRVQEWFPQHLPGPRGGSSATGPAPSPTQVSQ